MDIERNKLEFKVLSNQLNDLIQKATKDPSKYKAQMNAKQDELTNFKFVKPVRYVADDVTPEALISLLADNDGVMSVISSEGGIFETLQGKYSNTINIDAFLKAHCGDTLRVDRKGRPPEFIKNPALTVLLTIQPSVLEGLMDNQTFRGRGLNARFLYSLPISNVGRRRFETEPIPEQTKKDYESLCDHLLGIPRTDEAAIIKLSEEAKLLSAEFANKLEPRLIGDLEMIQDYAAKLHGAVLRIAGILHIIKNSVFAEKDLLPGETMKNAIQIGNYFLEHAKHAFQLMGIDEQTKGAQYVLMQLGKAKRKTIKEVRYFQAM